MVRRIRDLRCVREERCFCRPRLLRLWRREQRDYYFYYYYYYCKAFAAFFVHGLASRFPRQRGSRLRLLRIIGLVPEW